MATALKLPHWDLTPIYPALDSPEFEHDFAAVVDDISALGRLFERHGVRQQNSISTSDDSAHAFDEVCNAYNELLQKVATLGAYVNCFVSTDSRNQAAQARASELRQHSVRLFHLSTCFTAWIGSLDIEALLEHSDLAREHAFALRKMRVQADHLLPLAEEELAAELGPSGGMAWGRLHSDLSSQIVVPIDVHGEAQEVPMTVIRNLAHDPDRGIRRRAYEAEIGAWKRVAVPIAAALNSIKGESHTLSSRRGWEAPLDVALFNNNIDRRTLDAMLEAARAAFPDFRRYLKVKAKALGVPALAWYDIFAPVGESNSVWDYEHGASFLLEQFGTYSERLRGFAETAINENWIDAEPRPGKVGGAFCTSIRPGESRVLSNYIPSYDGVSTLAHELGHAYHNFNLAQRTMLQRQTPMTLAETASIFCETIIEHAALRRAEPQEQIAILEASIQGRCQVVVDITSRLLFEQRVFDGRAKRELSVDELCERMVDAQRETYGDGLDQSVLHPYMWAVKGHYYSPGRSFYNFPYMFGLLFGLGLYARYELDPVGFKAGYDDLLSSTGLEDVATLASQFGFNIHRPEFWNASFDIIRRDIARFEELLAAE